MIAKETYESEQREMATVQVTLSNFVLEEERLARLACHAQYKVEWE